MNEEKTSKFLILKFVFIARDQIEEAFQPYLRPRSRASAVLVLSSSNILVKRNLLSNPGSVREVATHLVDPGVVVDASENYWGEAVNTVEDYRRIFKSIFDQVCGPTVFLLSLICLLL